MIDLTYSTSGLFTQFYAETDSGIEAWNHAAKQDGGNFKIFNIHLPKVLYDLRKAGYKVAKAKSQKVTLTGIFDDELLMDLENDK